MQASLGHSFGSMRISARPQPALSFKASVGGQQLVGTLSFMGLLSSEMRGMACSNLQQRAAHCALLGPIITLIYISKDF